MKIITASTLGIAFLFVGSFFLLKTSEASVGSYSQITQPTPPPPNKPIIEITSPTPDCLPQPLPLSEKEKNNPVRELTAEEELNAGLGTSDWDCDGICNSKDNCIFAYNRDQTDSNGDGKGDVCDPKMVDSSFTDSRLLFDKKAEAERNALFTDAITRPSPTPPKSKPEKPDFPPSPTHGCSPQPKPLSEAEKNDPDRRENVFGESSDSDCDGICDIADNCPLVYNPDQKDSNKDGYGDACDPQLVDKSYVDLRCDTDGDGIPDNKDNCPWVCNPDQKFVDVNKNGVNDLCDNALPNAVTRQKPCPERIKVNAPKSLKSKSLDIKKHSTNKNEVKEAVNL